jgi:dipeptidyl aminopeptidase/acylaminoacyl peptidase
MRVRRTYRTLWPIMRVVLRVAVVAPVLTVPHFVGAQEHHFEFKDAAKLVRIADPQLSPDGKSIAVIMAGRLNPDQPPMAAIVAVDVSSGDRRVIVTGRREMTQPRWSPTGDRLAFLALAPTPKGDQPEIYVVPVSGGHDTAVTSVITGVQHFAWRPDGQMIAYVAADTAPNQSAIDKGDNAFEFENDDLFTSAAPTPSHIWLVAATGGEAKRLTSGAWSVAGGPPTPFLSWSPDGKSIAFMWQKSAHEGDQYETKIQIVDADNGDAVRDVTGRTKLESYPVFSPDGRHVAFWYPRGGDPNNETEIDIAASAGGSPTAAANEIDRSIVRVMWMPDSRSLILGGDDGARVSLWEKPATGAARRLDLGDVSPTWTFFWMDVDVGRDGAIAFTGSTPTHPTELYYMASPAAPPRRLTHLNDEAAALANARGDSVSWSGPNHFVEDGVVRYPPGFSPTKQYPLVLWIHGGPQAASTMTWDMIPALMAAQGYVVFSPNYRGSDNLGNAYERAIVQDASDGPGRDIMAGVAALERKGFIDRTRVAATGWSYGGAMTVWLIGHYPGWAAAVAGAPAVDFTDQYNLSDLNVTYDYAFGGSPWRGDAADRYRTQSAITGASHVRAPTLILQDLQDSRAPPTQAIKLYHALHDNGVRVSLVIEPVPGHFPGDPMHSRDVIRRMLAWLGQYLGPSEGATITQNP